MKAPAEPKSFEESLQTLERIVKGLEQGTLSLEESLEQYAQAARHLKYCYERLSQAEKTVQLLRGLDADGSPRSVPLEDSTEDLSEKQASRGKRRSSRTDLGE